MTEIRVNDYRPTRFLWIYLIIGPKFDVANGRGDISLRRGFKQIEIGGMDFWVANYLTPFRRMELSSDEYVVSEYFSTNCQCIRTEDKRNKLV